MSDGPWSPEHIYQEIVGYGKTWHRGEQGKKEMGQEGQKTKNYKVFSSILLRYIYGI